MNEIKWRVFVFQNDYIVEIIDCGGSLTEAININDYYNDELHQNIHVGACYRPYISKLSKAIF